MLSRALFKVIRLVPWPSRHSTDNAQSARVLAEFNESLDKPFYWPYSHSLTAILIEIALYIHSSYVHLHFVRYNKHIQILPHAFTLKSTHTFFNNRKICRTSVSHSSGWSNAMDPAPLCNMLPHSIHCKPHAVYIVLTTHTLTSLYSNCRSNCSNEIYHIQ